MSIVFFTDPHLGLKRSANTTAMSSRNLRAAISDKLKHVTDTMEGTKVCLGDLFDKYSNDEADILLASEAMRNIDVCLAGNHDVENRADSVGSLELLKSLHGDKVWLDSFERPQVHSVDLFDEEAVIIGIPHVRDQGVFDGMLKKAAALVEKGDKKYTVFLILHCNYDSGWELTETSLNLTKEKAEELLETFDYILLGHDHAPSDHFGGRLRVIGNMHPTCFGDISDKRALVFEDGEFRSEKLWYAEDGFLACDHSEIPESTTASFVRVTGDTDRSNASEVAKAVARLWKNSSDTLLGVKVDVNFTGESDTEFGEGRVTLEDLPAKISEELEGTEMGKLWEELNNAN